MEANRGRKRRLVLIANKLVAVITLIFFSAGNVFALPAGQQVVNGQAGFVVQGNNLNITNSPNAIINWQGFSINNNEVVRFIQQYGASAVLNRVIGQDPSRILGVLQSNGRVFLVNPNGILFGQGARIDVNGLFASTLVIGNQDFLAGKYNFAAGTMAGAIQNQGTITTPEGGKVYLIAPDIENSGIINSPQGEVLLAAGHSVQLVDSLNPDIAVVVSAPANKAVNLGQIVARSGKVGIYGGLIRQTGSVNADSAIVGENGKIIFKAKRDLTLDAGSVTSADGPQGGEVSIQSVAGTTLVSGSVSAKGTDGKGGSIQILGDQVGLIDKAAVDASGKTGGGTVLIGGDYQGKNAAIQNAEATYLGPEAMVRADATETGDGGKVIVWSDRASQVYGKISARGGALSGNGGFIETSGRQYLAVTQAADASAPNGKAGTWLLDPYNVTIQSTLGSMDVFSPPFFTPFDIDSTISNTIIENALNVLGTNVTINTGVGPYGLQAGDITVNAPITASLSPGASRTLTLTAHNNININQPITSNGAALNLTLNHGAAGSATLANSLSLAGGNVDVGIYDGFYMPTSGTGALNVTAGTTSFGHAGCDQFRHIGRYLEPQWSSGNRNHHP